MFSYILGALVLLSPCLGAQQGELFTKSYGPDVYASSARVYEVDQDNRGVIFAVAEESILEFDGAAWRTFKHPAGHSLRSIAVDEQGTLYYGGGGDFGFLRPVDSGYEFVSLLDQLPSEDRGVGTIHRVEATHEGVFFLSNQLLCRWRPDVGSLSFWRPEGNGYFHSLSVLDDRIVLASSIESSGEESFLSILSEGKLRPVPGSTALRGFIMNLVSLDATTALVVSQGHGLWEWSGESFKQLESAASQFARENYSGPIVKLSDNRFGMPTLRNGLCLFDRYGTIERVVGGDRGLPGLIRAFVDQAGGVWLGSGNGIHYADTRSGCQYFGPFDFPTAVARFGETLFVSTRLGTFALDSSGLGEDPVFQSLTAGAKARVNWHSSALLVSGGRLFGGAGSQLSDLSQNGSITTYGKLGFINDLAVSADGKRVCASTYRDGVRYIERVGSDWSVAPRIPGSSNWARYVVDFKGAIWASVKTDTGKFRIERTDPANGEDTALRIYDEQRGLQKIFTHSPYPFAWQGRLFVSSSNELYVYDEQVDAFRAGASLVEDSEHTSILGITASAVGPDDVLWVATRDFKLLRVSSRPEEPALTSIHEDITPQLIYEIYVEPSGTLWATTLDGLVLRYDKPSVLPDLPPRPILRVTGPNDMAYTYGAESRASGGPHIPYSREALRFEFSLPRFGGAAKTRYQHRLVGLNDMWSDWSTEPYRDFTELAGGSYRFEVRGQRGIEGISEVAAFDYQVIPPWYRTWWFQLSCVLAVVGSCWGIYSVRIAALARRARELVEHANTLQAEIVQREQAEQDRKRLEKEREALEKSLLESTRLEAIGRLAGGIAHDFNNVLTAVLGRSELLEYDLTSLQDEHTVNRLAHVRDISKCGKRAAALTRQLLAFSRQQVLSPEVIDPNEVIDGLLPMLNQLMPEQLTLDFLPDRAVRPIEVDPGQLEQVVMNLVLNARDAMPGNGRILLETAVAQLTEEYVTQHPQAQSGEHTMISVTDTGTGIEEEKLSHVFEPFYTTKEVGKGTGLGLASVYGIVKQSGGHILIYSEVGVGTIFKVYLPVATEGVNLELIPAVPPSQDLAGVETILVCDDDESIRKTIELVLVSKGYRVLVATSPSLAIELATAQPIDILITDVVMPEMNGRELSERILELQGALVLYVSGYTSNVIVHNGIVDGGLNFLEKPFTPTQLLTTVRGLLDAHTRAEFSTS